MNFKYLLLFFCSLLLVNGCLEVKDESKNSQGIGIYKVGQSLPHYNFPENVDRNTWFVWGIYKKPILKRRPFPLIEIRATKKEKYGGFGVVFGQSPFASYAGISFRLYNGISVGKILLIIEPSHQEKCKEEFKVLGLNRKEIMSYSIDLSWKNGWKNFHIPFSDFSGKKDCSGKKNLKWDHTYFYRENSKSLCNLVDFKFIKNQAIPVKHHFKIADIQLMP